MKLSALAAQIKSCGHCEVINNGGRIFVGTGSAFYCMDGYPRTQDAGELGAMLGIPQKKMKNIFYHEECTIDGKLYGVKWDDEPEHEGNTSEIKTRIAVNGEELIALRNPDGSVGFIRSELLKPVEGELNKEFAQLCVRPANQDCRFIYAVKDGMILRALIAPMNIKDDVADDLDEIIAELMSRRQQNIVKKMHDDLQDVIAQETAEKAAQVENKQE